MPRAFCEFPAGVAAVSVRLHGGPRRRPPVTRRGNKAGFSGTILDLLGLRSGAGAGRYVWADSDPDVRALLQAYANPAVRREVAEIIRGWPEPPRELWDRLLAARKAGGLPPALALATWIVVGQWSFRRCEPESGYNKGVAEGMAATATHNGGGPLTVGDLAQRLDLLAGDWPAVDVLSTLPEAAELAELLGTPGDLRGVVIYMDPPYVGTTRYADDFPRAEVVRLAVDYQALGALVAVSEACPVDELVAAGWEAIDILAERRGQALTFRRGDTGEWLTMSRRPVFRPAVQIPMFGGSP